MLQKKEIQLEIWAVPYTEEHRQWADIIELRDSVHNIRRGLFRRFHELQDKVCALEEEIKYLRSGGKEEKFELKN